MLKLVRAWFKIFHSGVPAIQYPLYKNCPGESFSILLKYIHDKHAGIVSCCNLSVLFSFIIKYSVSQKTTKRPKFVRHTLKILEHLRFLECVWPSSQLQSLIIMNKAEPLLSTKRLSLICKMILSIENFALWNYGISCVYLCVC